MSRTDLILHAREHLNTKWRHQGRVPGESLDCVGLLIVVARSIGVEVVDDTNYSSKPGSAGLIKHLLQYCDEIQMEVPRLPGDILIVSVAGEDPQHCMMWTDQGTVIHASAKHRKVVEHSLDMETKRGLCKVFRLRGLDG